MGRPVRTRSPLDWLHRALAACLDEAVFAEVVKPTLADLRHEVLHARAGWPRALAWGRGAWALARAVFVGAWEGPHVPVRVAAVVVLGLSGAALANWARVSGLDGRLGNSGLLLPMLLAPLLVHYLDGRSSYAQRFVTSVAVGLVASLALDLTVSIERPPALAWHVLWFAIAGSLVVGSSALAAASVWTPRRPGASFAGQAFAGIFYAGLIATVMFFARNAARGTQQPLDLFRAPFYLVMFGVLIGGTVLPLVLVARHWIRRRAALVLLALASFPLPIIAGQVVEGRSLAQALADCLQWSLPMLLSSSPFLAGATILGWIVGAATDRPLTER
jgi:hypothetical protein